MGNAKSKSGNSETINEINQIATDYILENPDMDFFLDPKYCSELNILTKKAFDKNFTLSEVETLGKGIKVKEKIYSISKSAWNKERLVDPVRKEYICEQLSKFYVKIAHVFAAIVDTIKPVSSSQNPSYKKLMSWTPTTFREIPNDNFCLNRLNNLESAIKESRKPAAQTICKELKDKSGNQSIEKWNHEIGSKTFTDLFKWEDPITKQILYENSIQLFRENLTGKKGKCAYRTKTYNENKNKRSSTKNDILYKDYCSTKLCNDLNNKIRYTCIDKTKLGIKYKQHIEDMRKRYHKNLESLYSFIKDIFEQKNNRWIIKSSLTEQTLDIMIPKIRATIAKCYFDCNNDYIKGLKIYTSVYEYYLITKKQRTLIDCDQPNNNNLPNKNNLEPDDKNLPNKNNLEPDDKNLPRTVVPPPIMRSVDNNQRRHDNYRHLEETNKNTREPYGFIPRREITSEEKKQQEEKQKKQDQDAILDYRARELLRKEKEEIEKKKENEERQNFRYHPMR